nr:hypothetical protein [Tanacetum cinerariifolium]
MRDTIAQTRSKNVSKIFNDPLLARGNTLRSGEDSMKLNELMKLCTNLKNKVIDLENTKTTQALEIESLKRRVKKLEKKQRGEEVFVSQEIPLKEPIVDVAQVTTIGEVNVASNATTNSAIAKTITIDDITLAKALEAIKTFV